MVVVLHSEGWGKCAVCDDSGSVIGAFLVGLCFVVRELRDWRTVSLSGAAGLM